MIFEHPLAEMTPTRRLQDGVSVTIGKRNYEPNPYFENQPNMILNQGLDLVPAPDFFPVSVPSAPGQEPVQGFLSMDPRLIDTLRNDRLVLDRPAFQPSNVQPLYKPPKDYQPPSAFVYPSYKAITGGNYQYYVDRDLSQAFFPPMYQIPSTVQPSLYRDPMGGMKPYYQKTPILETNAALSEYSFDQDQMSFREDIMSRQSSLMDRTDFSKFHSHFPQG